MTETRGILMRLKVRPDAGKLTNAERNHLAEHFDPYAGEVVINGQPVEWRAIDEVEVAKAARSQDPSGWFVKALYGEERYHVGVYYGAYEAVLVNLTLNSAQYVVRMIAFYAPQQIRYSGIDGLSPLEQS
jgi:hypothetical protein